MAPPKRSSLPPSKRLPSASSGIQRFFLCTTATPSASASTPNSTTTTTSPPPSLTPPPDASARAKPSLAAHDTQQEKRMRISPGSIIVQSQDDGGGDQVEWKLSPTVERLQEAHAIEGSHHSSSALSMSDNASKKTVILNKDIAGADAPHLAANGIKRRSPTLAGKLEQWLSTAEATPNQKLGLQKATPVRSCERSDRLQQTPASRDKENYASVLGPEPGSRLLQKGTQNVGRLISCSSSLNSLVAKSSKRRSAKKRESGKRRKALLELLDQVQNVISDPESTSNHADHVEEDSFLLVKPRRGCFDTPAKVACSPMYNQIAVSDKSHTSMESPEDTTADGMNITQHKNSIEKSFEQADFELNAVSSNAGTIPESLANIHFLVLEVADITGASCSQTKVLRLLNEYNGVERVLYLTDEWFSTIVRPGDTVNVIGDFVDGQCTIDHKNNLLIVHPDILISGSKVGGSFSCPRRAVLDERIRSSSVAFPALLGTMMHELFQIGLMNRSVNKMVLEQEAELLVYQHIDSLYACGGNEKDALDKLKGSIPTIMNWLDCFLHASTSAIPKVDFGMKEGQHQVFVSEVIDIEETIYSPKYGLKGMIDASLYVKFGNMDLAECKVLPLEFKSGKSTTGQAALEHRAQVILYSLLMSDRYTEPVDSGLLYYLQTNETKGVPIQHADIMGLVMRRNELATDLLLASTTQQLPPMLQSMHACQRCWHLDACSIYHKAQEGGTTESSGIGELFNEKTEHLKDSYFEFLKLWDCLIDLEAQELQASQREIWRLPAQERETSGRCLSSMRLNVDDDGMCEGHKKRSGFVYCFTRDCSYASSKKKGRSQMKGFHELSFCCGDHVLLSIENGHVAVASGSICHITQDHVSVKLSHQLRVPNEKCASDIEVLLKQVWRMDKDETASFLATMRFNMLQLFHKNGHEQGRRLVVDLEKPRFDGGSFFSQDPAVSYVRSRSDLNEDQRQAIFKVLSARDYALILGMPGTGKTSTIVHVVKALIARGASILLTSYTNSAVDNILLKLKQLAVDFVRLGREHAIHPDLKEHVIEGLNIKTVEQLDQRMKEVHVVAVTCLGVTHPLLTDRKFDVCIVDEAGQITLPVCLGPLRFASSFVLVGDHYQLPPLVRNAEARERGLSVSLFRRLSEAHPQAIAALQCQYRMNAGIMSLCNNLIYGNRLQCGSLEVANAKLTLNGNITNHGPIWLRQAVDATRPVIFLNTDMLVNSEANAKNSKHNIIEASIVIMIIKQMLKGGIDAKDIGVISPYNYQVQHIHHLLANEFDMLEVNTIDRFQGRDKDCVLVSFVKSTSRGNTPNLLADWRRINVAITRAKKKLILIGSQTILSTTPVLRLLISEVERAGGVVNVPQDSRFLLGGLKPCNAVVSGESCTI